MKHCSVEGCTKEYYAKGYCKTHYKNFNKNNDPISKYIKRRNEEVGEKYKSRSAGILYEITQIDQRDDKYYAKFKCCNCGREGIEELNKLRENLVRDCVCKKLRNYSENVLSTLSDRQRAIYADYSDNMCLKDIALKHHTTKVAVGNMRRRILHKLNQLSNAE